MKKYELNCPVCEAVVEEFEICSICGWQNTGQSNVDGGPNRMALEEAKSAWERKEPIE